MVERYCGGRVPPRRGKNLVLTNTLQDSIFGSYETLEFGNALAGIWDCIGQLNQYIVRTAPWELAKDAGKREQLEEFLSGLLEDVREIATLVYPVMPRAATRIFAMLGLNREPGPQDVKWGEFELEPGSPLGAIEPLFPRVETNRKEAAVSEEKPTPPPVETTQAAPPPVGDKIDIADFARVELKAARVTAAERVAGSKKLIKLQVDLGSESRQVVAGIAEAYAPEALVGKTVVVVANLKPAKLMGQESNGMVLAGSIDGRPVLCTFDGDVPPGTKVK
jgi:methionyl-tRNA synthetase